MCGLPPTGVGVWNWLYGFLTPTPYFQGAKLIFSYPMGTQNDYVPFVNRPFESEIHGTVNFTYFCCFLLVTWCHCVLLSCYLRPK